MKAVRENHAILMIELYGVGRRDRLEGPAVRPASVDVTETGLAYQRSLDVLIMYEISPVPASPLCSSSTGTFNATVRLSALGEEGLDVFLLQLRFYEDGTFRFTMDENHAIVGDIRTRYVIPSGDIIQDDHMCRTKPSSLGQGPLDADKGTGPTPTTSSLLWVNPSDTLVALAGGCGGDLTSTFVSESGVIDLLLYPGMKPQEFSTAYHRTTGLPTLPPLFGLGFHRSRYAVESQQDIYNLAYKYTDKGFPVDVFWLDIEHTNGKD
ncbi:hypothetical protein FOL46_010039, partial [Perkinsus olseni]